MQSFSAATSFEKIRNLIPEAALYEQLAEECSELAQACLKKSRKIRNENYTPKTNDQIDTNILEEFTDLLLVANVIELSTDPTLYKIKLKRWIERNEKNTE